MKSITPHLIFLLALMQNQLGKVTSKLKVPSSISERKQGSIIVYRYQFKVLSTILFVVFCLQFLFINQFLHAQNEDTLITSSEKQDMASINGEVDDFVMRKSFAEAENVLNRGLSQDEQNVALLYRLAEIQSWDNKYDDSIYNYKKILSLQPENIGIRKQIATVIVWKANKENKKEILSEARDEYLKYLQTKPNDIETIIRIGDIYLQEEDLEKAKDWLLKAIDLDFKQPEGIRLLGGLYIKQGKYKEATELINKYLNTVSNNIHLQWMRAEIALDEHDFKTAQQAYSEILNVSPTHEGALLGSAKVNSWQKKYNKSIALYKQAASLDSLASAPYIGLGDVASWRNRWRTAKKAYSSALVKEPGNPSAQSGYSKSSWEAAYGLITEYSYSSTNQGINYQSQKAGMTFLILQPIDVGLFMKRMQFSQQPTNNDVVINQYIASFHSPLYKSFSIDAEIIQAQFAQSDSNRFQHYWESRFNFQLNEYKIWLSYSRLPILNDIYAIDPSFRSDNICVAFNLPMPGRLSLQGSVDRNRITGVQKVGYFNNYTQQWVTFEALARDTDFICYNGQVSFRLARKPDFNLRYSASGTPYRSGEYPVQWSPAQYKLKQKCISDINIGLGRYSSMLLNGEFSRISDTGSNEWRTGLALVLRLSSHFQLVCNGCYNANLKLKSAKTYDTSISLTLKR
jgi:tetratricopeptide (TPR) repeat protein